MLKTIRKALVSVAAAGIIALWAAPGLSQDASDVLACNDISSFNTILNCVCRAGRGILVTADHFGEDHKDVDCYVTYYSKAQRTTVNAEVTLHADPPAAIKWLLHEVDKDFRTYYGTPDPGYIIRNIDGNTLYTFESKGRNYRWISGNKVIMLEYHDTGMTKSEPIEVVRAYLAKHPSTLSTMPSAPELRSATNEMRWIKDEMERRLWLCDKWFLNLSIKRNGVRQVREEILDSMNIFLNYREKYFGIKAADEKNLLTGYFTADNSGGFKTKLAEYKDWWETNKDKTSRM
jgi:hypothetical protein